jgi:hypothetical protein
MDAREREFLQAAVSNINEHNAELMERFSEWAMGVRDRTKAWLWFIVCMAVAMTLAARAALSVYIVAAGTVVSSMIFEWALRKKAQREWRRHHFARLHFQALLESRKTLENMTREQRETVEPKVREFLLNTFLPVGLERSVFWDDVEDGIVHTSFRRLKLESMGLFGRREEFPNAKSAEYAWDRYGEIDPDRKWIIKLRPTNPQAGT